jgi:hypothetical protein
MQQIARSYFGSWLMSLVALVGLTTAFSLFLGYIPLTAMQGRDAFFLTVVAAEAAACVVFAYQMNWLYTWGFRDEERNALVASLGKVSVFTSLLLSAWAVWVFYQQWVEDTWNWILQPINWHIIWPPFPIALEYFAGLLVLGLTLAAMAAIAMITFNIHHKVKLPSKMKNVVIRKA